MSGPQFANLQTYSRKSNKFGNSVKQIISEGIRDAAFSHHVEDPEPPRVLLGDPHGFQKLHDDHVAARAVTVKMKDGSTRRRAIRKDRPTMASVVMSYPVPWSAIDTNDKRQRMADWEDRNMAFLKARYGEQLKVVFAHEDEEHPHLHAWLLPDDPSAHADTLHPGKTAKSEVEAKAKADGVAPREAVKMGNRAYKEAMTVWQDEYYAAVGAPEGLTRLGPKRQRLSRAQYRAQKNAAEATARYEATVKAEVQGTEETLRIARLALNEVNSQGRAKVSETQALEARAKEAKNAEAAAHRRAVEIGRKAQARDGRIERDARANADALMARAEAGVKERLSSLDERELRLAKLDEELQRQIEGLKADREAFAAESAARAELMGDVIENRLWWDLDEEKIDITDDRLHRPRIVKTVTAHPRAAAYATSVAQVLARGMSNALSLFWNLLRPEVRPHIDQFVARPDLMTDPQFDAEVVGEVLEKGVEAPDLGPLG